MIAVLGPKSLYSGLEMCSFPAVELNEANIIHDTRTTYPAMSAQSAMLEPLDRRRYKSGEKPKSVFVSTRLASLCFHTDRHTTAIVARKNKRLPHKSGCCARVKSKPA